MLEQRSDRFTVVRELGRGGMGTVCLARKGRSRRLVALKALKEEYASDPRAVRRFQREVRVLATLRHPNIVRVLDFDTSAAPPWFAMEFCPSGEFVPRTHAANATQLIYFFLQACEGVAFAHARGVLHRDLKPANLLMGNDGLVKVADFGLAVAIVRDTTPITSSGIGLGTLPYMSPEQVVNAKRVTVGSDIYSLGVTLYEWLTGCLPGTRAKRPPIQLPGLSRAAVKRVFDTIDICLRGPYAHRFDSMSLLMTELDRAVQGR